MYVYRSLNFTKACPSYLCTTPLPALITSPRWDSCGLVWRPAAGPGPLEPTTSPEVESSVLLSACLSLALKLGMASYCPRGKCVVTPYLRHLCTETTQNSLTPWSPGFMAPETGFREDNFFPWTGVRGMVSG